MIERYSIVFYPPPEIVAVVRQLKQELKQRVGRYASVNSDAHITICEFTGTNHELEEAKSYLEKFANGMAPAEVCFNGMSSFPNGAFYLSPDVSSKQYMEAIMKLFAKSFLLEPLFTVDNPHLTIGRRLDAAALTLAFDLFSDRNFDLHYICNRISLRRFNPEKRQFDVIAHFYFEGQSDIFGDGAQLQLF